MNPLVKVREDLGKSRKELALMIGTTYHRIYEIESGYTASIPQVITDFFKAHCKSVNVDDLQEQYKTWKEEQRKEQINKLN